MSKLKSFPPQQISYKRKNKEWRRQHLDWADDHTTFHSSSLVRSSILNKQINYDLVNGKIHMDDMMLILNPTGLNSAFIPDTIQHYAVLNSNLMYCVVRRLVDGLNTELYVPTQMRLVRLNVINKRLYLEVYKKLYRVSQSLMTSSNRNFRIFQKSSNTIGKTFVK